MFLLVLIQKCVYLVCLCPQMLQEVVAKTLKHHGITAEHDCFEACSKRLFDISKFYLKVCLFTALSESVLCFCLTLSLFVLLYDSRTCFVLYPSVSFLLCQQLEPLKKAFFPTTHFLISLCFLVFLNHLVLFHSVLRSFT